MNYLKEVVAFANYLLYNRLSTGEIALWYALMAANNRLGWRDDFDVSGFAMMQTTGLSKSGLAKARNGLKQKGLIDYIPGKGSKPGKYRMISFVGKIVDTMVDTTVDTMVDTMVDTTVDAMVDTCNKHKYKYKYKLKHPPYPPEQKNLADDIREVVEAGKEIGLTLTNEDELRNLFSQGAKLTLFCYAIEQAEKKKAGWSYAKAIIVDRIKRGIFESENQKSGECTSYDLQEFERMSMEIPKIFGSEDESKKEGT